jgi:hypothetical protein
MFGTMLPILEDYLPLDGALQVYLQQMIIYLWSLHFRLTFIIFLPFLKLKKSSSFIKHYKLFLFHAVFYLREILC